MVLRGTGAEHPQRAGASQPGPAFPRTQTLCASTPLPRGCCSRSLLFLLHSPGVLAAFSSPPRAPRGTAPLAAPLAARPGAHPPLCGRSRRCAPAPSRTGPGLPPPPRRAEGPAESRGSALAAAAISCSLCGRRGASPAEHPAEHPAERR